MSEVRKRRSFVSWRVVEGEFAVVYRRVFVLSFVLVVFAGLTSFFGVDSVAVLFGGSSVGTGLVTGVSSDGVEVKGGQAVVVEGFVRSVEVPLGTAPMTLGGDSSPAVSGPVAAMLDINAVYDSLLNSVEGSREQKADIVERVLNVPRSTIMYITISDVPNGGSGHVTTLWKYFVEDYRVSDFERCFLSEANLRNDPVGCSSPCGGKGQACCDASGLSGGFCFADGFVKNAVKDKNSRCYNNICNCGFIGQRACTSGKDSSQPHECVNSRAVKFTDGKCVVCGLVGLPPCDASRAGKTCFTGVSSGSENCRLLTALSPGVGGGGSGGGVPAGPCGSPDTWCSSECVTDEGVPTGCDPAELNDELKQEADKAAQAIFEDYSLSLPEGQNAYSYLKNLATSPQAAVEQVEKVEEDYIDITFPSGPHHSVSGTPNKLRVEKITVDSINELYDNMANNDVEIDKECETKKFEGGICVQEVGEEGIPNHPEWCEDQEISPTTGKCCWSSGHGSASEANCCSNAHEWRCTIQGGSTIYGAKSECDSACANSECVVENTKKCI